jgi:hypothetical protein
MMEMVHALLPQAVSWAAPSAKPSVVNPISATAPPVPLFEPPILTW